MKSDIKAFRMWGNLYFVGSSRVSVHMIDTECGLVLIDAGYPDMYEQITDSIESLGFDPADICAIIHSHGHIDHYGTTERLKAISGAKTYISRIDNDIVNGTLPLSWTKELGLEPIPDFDCDCLIDDGDVLTFGSVSIRCVSTPGHTDGTLSFFITLTDGDKSIVAAMHGGVGFNTLQDSFLDKYGLPHTVRDRFREGLHRVRDEKVDLVLGNHPQQNDTAGKMLRLEAGESSVLDPDEWKRFITSVEKRLDDTFYSNKG